MLEKPFYMLETPSFVKPNLEKKQYVFMREILDYMMVPFNCQLVRILHQLNKKFPGTLLTHNFRLSSGHVYERSLDKVIEVGSIISYARILDCTKRKNTEIKYPTLTSTYG